MFPYCETDTKTQKSSSPQHSVFERLSPSVMFPLQLKILIRKRTKSNFLFLSLQIFPQACVVHTQCIRNAIVLLQVRYANLSRWNPGFSFFLDRARASSKCCAFLKWDTKCLGCAVYSSNAGLPNSNLSWATLHLTFSHDKWLNILEINTICRVATTI